MECLFSLVCFDAFALVLFAGMWVAEAVVLLDSLYPAPTAARTLPDLYRNHRLSVRRLRDLQARSASTYARPG